MSPLGTFCWGFAGSVAVEVVALLGFYYADPLRLPQHYRRPGFWVTRLALALLGGALAVGYEIEQAILAFNIGAATPLIITSLARGVQPNRTPQRASGYGSASDELQSASRESPHPPGEERRSKGAGR